VPRELQRDRLAGAPMMFLAESAARTRRGITSVLRLRLADSGRALEIERTGFRAEPPAVLHRRPHDRQNDLVYNVDRVRYVRGR
jgi:hypothetical protein